MRRNEKKSPFRMGWLMAIFDLPTMLEKERRAATLFRKALLDDGFIMIQYSVYARPCVSIEKIVQHEKRIKSFAPQTGDVRLLFFTDKQWGQTKIIVHKDVKPPPLEKIPKQIEFW